jgi:hypothetical protein
MRAKCSGFGAIFSIERSASVSPNSVGVVGSARIARNIGAVVMSVTRRMATIRPFYFLCVSRLFGWTTLDYPHGGSLLGIKRLIGRD